jgi:hypothetical protein
MVSEQEPDQVEDFVEFAAKFLNRDKDEVMRTFVSSFAPDEGLERAAIAFEALTSDEENAG